MTQALRGQFRPLVGVSLMLMFLTVVIYPLVVTGIAQVAFPSQANGSIVEVGGKAVGSSLVGQLWEGDTYFHGRPSAAGAGYDAAASSGSNLGPTSAKLIEGIHDPANPAGDVDGIKDRAAAFRETNGLADDAILPSDAVTASASGLDPHVSPATARLQVARVAKARGVAEADVRAVLDEHTELPALGIIGEPRVNVLLLNIALDARFPAKR
jgi:K+-transporting ATPase ATPase C chain